MKRNFFPTMSNIVVYGPVVFWMLAIFFMSSMTGSPVEYEMPTRMFLERKGAHVFEYFVLTLLFSRALLFRLPYHRVRAILLSVYLTLIYAVSDEIHQLSVFGRTGKATDVLIDGIGIAAASVLLFVFTRRKEKIS